MSKAFTKEPDGAENEDDLLPENIADNLSDDDANDEPEINLFGMKNLMTPTGHKTLQDELRFLLKEERPRIVEIVSWAAGNGDRSENGDYIYNKKRLREIDRRLRYLTKRLETAEIVDPARQQGIEQVFFGATVTYARQDDTEITVKLVGVDEADLDHGKINWLSPVGKALMKSKIGDSVDVRVDGRIESIEVVTIQYIIEIVQ